MLWNVWNCLEEKIVFVFNKMIFRLKYWNRNWILVLVLVLVPDTQTWSHTISAYICNEWMCLILQIWQTLNYHTEATVQATGYRQFNVWFLVVPFQYSGIQNSLLLKNISIFLIRKLNLKPIQKPNKKIVIKLNL